jgi:hypothetical protein
MGGIGLILIVIILIALVVIGFFLYTTGGLLWKRKTDPSGDRIEGGPDSSERRPQHTRPTTPAQEHTDFVGTPDPP